MGAAIVGIAILLSLPAYADEPRYDGYFDIEYMIELWEEPTIEAFMRKVEHINTPEIVEAYRGYNKMGTAPKRQAYLAKHPLKEKIKRLSDAVNVFKAWESEYRFYGDCSDESLFFKTEFYSFETFRKAYETYADVHCRRVDRPCAELKNPRMIGSFFKVEQCAILPDWRTGEQKAADESRAKTATKKLPQ